MAYGGPFSQLANVKGITGGVTLPQLGYVNVQGDSSSRSSSKAVVIHEPQHEKTRPQVDPVRVSYTRASGRSGFGTDPMVSQASVIHELSYGRIYGGSSKSPTGEGYPVTKEYVPHRLDIIV